MDPYRLIGEDEEVVVVTEAVMDVVGMADAGVAEAGAVGVAEVETYEPINEYR